MLQHMTSSEIAGYARVVWIWVLGLLGVCSWVGLASAFDQACGTLLASHRATVEAAAAVVAVQTSGRATGTYMAVQQGVRQWRLEEGDFTLTGRGFVVDRFVVTAAHVVSPAEVDLRLNSYMTTTTEVVSIQQTSVTVSDLQEGDRVPAVVVYLNQRLDLAILRPQASPQSLFPYPPAATWWHEGTGEASSLLNTGDCVVALVMARDLSLLPLSQDEARQGMVLAPHAVSRQRFVIAGLSANTVSISTPVFPGDSGSPVVAFDAGKPRLIGVITATRQPFEAVSYLSRVDPLLPILEALRTSTRLDGQVARAR